MISKRLPLDDVNEGLAALREGGTDLIRQMIIID